MGELNTNAEFIRGLQHALDSPIQALGNLRSNFLTLREEIGSGNGPVDLKSRIDELIFQAHKKAPQFSEEFIKGLLKIH